MPSARISADRAVTAVMGDFGISRGVDVSLRSILGLVGVLMGLLQRQRGEEEEITTLGFNQIQTALGLCGGEHSWLPTTG